MTARLAKTAGSLLVAAAVAASGCTTAFEVPIETPIQPKLDITQFQRVLVAGFITGGSDEVDANLETTRLLRSQLRTKSALRVIDADTLPLAEIARQELGIEAGNGNGHLHPQEPPPIQDPRLPPRNPDQDPSEDLEIRDERDLARFEAVFSNVEYWKKIGEEYQEPLIVTGTILFMPHARSGFVQREQEVYDGFGVRRVVPVRTYQERRGFILRPTFIFIDGRTGETLHTETFREEILYSMNQQTPPLSSYFELMDRLLPTFLNTLSAQKIRGTRVLLK